MRELGYEVVDKIVWVKLTKLGKLVNGNGVTVRHSEETCLIGRTGNYKRYARFHKANNVIVGKVRGESVKPAQIYQVIQEMTTTPYCMEIVGRPWNLQPNYVTVGNQLWHRTGTFASI